MPDRGPGSRSSWTDPDSLHRLLALLAVLSALLVAVASDWMAATAGAGYGMLAFLVYLFVRAEIMDEARRDYATDVAQNIHDGNLTASDLRRTRGYKNIEDAIDRHDNT